VRRGPCIKRARASTVGAVGSKGEGQQGREREVVSNYWREREFISSY
jgi:hypothetical protein